MPLHRNISSIGNPPIGRTPSGAIVSAALWKYDYYVRDASGNILANYSKIGAQVVWTSSEIYGSSRLGVYSPNKEIVNTTGNPTAHTTVDEVTVWRGLRNYELANHLGNVLAVVTDRKIGKNGTTTGSWTHYEAVYQSISDYYPFGSTMEERSWAAGEYRYGFNGKEKDNETFEGAIAFEARIYDSRIGRFLSRDPREAEYAWQTPYAYFKNSPISVLDIKGMGGKDEKPEKTKRYGLLKRIDNYMKGEGYLNRANKYQSENGGTLTQGRFSNGVKYASVGGAGFKDKSNHDAQYGQPDKDEYEAVQEGGKLIAEFHPAIPLYNLASRAGMMGDGSDIWGEDQTSGSVALDVGGIIPVGKIGKIAAKGVAKETVEQVSKNFNKISDNLLKKSGIDAHQLKKDFLGNKAQISKYDLYKDTKTSEILILQKGGKGTPIQTGEFLK